MATLFAANWKMHHGSERATAFAQAFKELTSPDPDRTIWFFPPATSIQTLAHEFGDRPDVAVGAQDVHWEPSGAYTGALSIPLAQEAGATVALVGHSERRHVFHETDEETGRKVTALLDNGMRPVLCVGELVDERERGETEVVVQRQMTEVVAGRGHEERVVARHLEGGDLLQPRVGGRTQRELRQNQRCSAERREERRADPENSDDFHSFQFFTAFKGGSPSFESAPQNWK